MKTSVDGLEKERDFYFGKLRDIEVLCQEEGAVGTDLSEKVLAILYATEVCHFLVKSIVIVLSLFLIDCTLIFYEFVISRKSRRVKIFELIALNVKNTCTLIKKRFHEA